MIDIHREEMFPLSLAPKRMPNRRMGRPTATSTVFRWSSKGLRGHLLETVMIGGVRFTSLEALNRFFSNVTAAKSAEAKPSTDDATVDAGLRANGLVDGVA